LRRLTDHLPSITTGHTSLYGDSLAKVASLTSEGALPRYRDLCYLMLHLGKGLALLTTGTPLTVWEARLSGDEQQQDKIMQLRW
jgi:hypothetical protein